MIDLSAEDKKGRFDALAGELDIAVSHYDMEQVKSLVAFVMREKTIREQSFLVVDLTDGDGGLRFSGEHILSAVQSLRCFSAARPVFIAPASEETKALFGRLLGDRVTNLIETTDKTDIVGEMRRCLSEEGMTLVGRAETIQNGAAAAAKAVVQPIKIPEGRSVSVCVCGCMPRIGATTQTIAVWRYLKSLGFSPAVLTGDEGFLKLLAAFYRDELQTFDGYLAVKGIPFCGGVIAGQFNAYVNDAGVLSEKNHPLFSGADISVLVGGSKPWEMAAFSDCIKLARGTRRFSGLLSFTKHEDAEELSRLLLKKVLPAPYRPDFWEDGGGSAVYREALLSYLTEVCGRQ